MPSFKRTKHPKLVLNDTDDPDTIEHMFKYNKNLFVGGKGVIALFIVDSSFTTISRVFSKSMNQDLRNPTRNQLKGVYPVQKDLEGFYLWIGLECWLYKPTLSTMERKDVLINSAPTEFYFLAHSVEIYTGFTIWLTSSTDTILKASNFNDPGKVKQLTLATTIGGNFPIQRVLGLSCFMNVYFVLVQQNPTTMWLIIGDIGVSATEFNGKIEFMTKFSKHADSEFHQIINFWSNQRRWCGFQIANNEIALVRIQSSSSNKLTNDGFKTIPAVNTTPD